MQRFMLQLIAIVLVLVMIVALTLTVLGELSPIGFWITAGVIFAASYLFYRK